MQAPQRSEERSEPPDASASGLSRWSPLSLSYSQASLNTTRLSGVSAEAGGGARRAVPDSYRTSLLTRRPSSPGDSSGTVSHMRNAAITSAFGLPTASSRSGTTTPRFTS